MFVDNIESDDIEITKCAHFENHRNLCAIESIRLGLDHTDFILTGCTARKLLDSLLPAVAGDIESVQNHALISRCGVFTGLGWKTRLNYVVDVLYEGRPLKVALDMCAGIAPCIAVWDELNALMHRRESSKPGTGFQNGAHYDMLACAQNPIRLLFVIPGSQTITITGVRAYLPTGPRN
jgi:hypothetical protein